MIPLAISQPVLRGMSGLLFMRQHYPVAAKISFQNTILIVFKRKYFPRVPKLNGPDMTSIAIQFHIHRIYYNREFGLLSRQC